MSERPNDYERAKMVFAGTGGFLWILAYSEFGLGSSDVEDAIRTRCDAFLSRDEVE